MAICTICKNETSITEMNLLDEELVCNSCYSKQNPTIEELTIDKCVVCEKHLIKDDMKKYSKQIYCSECYSQSLHFPIPSWVKLFAIIMFIVPVLGLFVNGKYFYTLSAMRKATNSFVNGNINDSVALIDNALQKLPDNTELQTRKYFYSGIHYFQQGDELNALANLKKYSSVYPEDIFTKSLVYYLEIGVSFENKDYWSMYNYSKELVNLNPDDLMNQLQLASSLACLYVERNEEPYKFDALKVVKDVESNLLNYKEEERKDLMEYVERIKYRIDSKSIISREEYSEKIKGEY